jgi:hypothetical protein
MDPMDCAKAIREMQGKYLGTRCVHTVFALFDDGDSDDGDSDDGDSDDGDDDNDDGDDNDDNDDGDDNDDDDR